MDENELRKTGFGKDGKHQQPQIVLGLLVSAGGYPIDYNIFKGQCDTMLPVLQYSEKNTPNKAYLNLNVRQNSMKFKVLLRNKKTNY